MDNKTFTIACQSEEKSWSTIVIIFVSLGAITAISAIILNSVIIFAFFREKKLRRSINYYIISLAIADFCVGLIGIPIKLLLVSFSASRNILFH